MSDLIRIAPARSAHADALRALVVAGHAHCVERTGEGRDRVGSRRGPSQRRATRTVQHTGQRAIDPGTPLVRVITDARMAENLPYSLVASTPR